MFIPRIDNQPPGVPSLDPPPGLVAQIERLETEIAAARSEMRQWVDIAEARRTLAWYRYHQQHGWPRGNEDYRRRLTTAGRQATVVVAGELHDENKGEPDGD